MVHFHGGDTVGTTIPYPKSPPSDRALSTLMTRLAKALVLALLAATTGSTQSQVLSSATCVGSAYCQGWRTQILQGSARRLKMRCVDDSIESAARHTKSGCEV